MKEKFEQLLHMVERKRATDVHFTLMQHRLHVQVRGWNGLETVQNAAFDEGLFCYLKYISNLDLGNTLQPQSGNFQYEFRQELLYFRFSLLPTLEKQTAVLRVLNNHKEISLEDLSLDSKQTASFLNWTKTRSGLIVLSGPTGSGKTTTLHAILKRIAQENRLHVVSLEDPIEIFDDSYLQLQINEAMGFTYEKGIEELLRHDPDVILIGETRNAYTARMVIRAALTGHMVFTTLHAKNALESLHRLLDFGLSEYDLKNTLTAVISQRLYKTKDIFRKECVYEILDAQALDHAIEKHEYPKEHRKLEDEIQNAVEQGYIFDPQAQFDIKDFQR